MMTLYYYACVLLVSALFIQPEPDIKSLTQTNGQVEVKTDDGVTSIKLKETSLLDKHDRRLTLTLETLFAVEAPGHESYVATFYSYSKSDAPFGDLEIHCTIDGKPLSLNKAQRPEFRDRARPRPSDEFYTLISLQDLGEIANGTKVEMRIGSVEWTIPTQSLQAIREFVDIAKKHKESVKKARR
jgi:hypothetical protein